MNRDGHENVEYFIGPEVEQTPAFSKRTLFVVGKKNVTQIEEIARKNKTPHIFLGANHSFVAAGPADTYWNDTITQLLDKGYWVTLDYEAHNHETVLKMLNRGIWQSRLFVPLLGVRIPYLQTSSPNLTVKIDDIDFEATNEGVWCLHHHQITDSNRFTPWQDYKTDQVVDTLPAPVTNTTTRVVTPNNVVTKLTIPEPALNMDAVKNIVEAGLDPDTPSQLKPENEEAKTTIDPVTSPIDAAEAYAEGTKEDPLSAKESGKKAKIRK